MKLSSSELSDLINALDVLIGAYCEEEQMRLQKAYRRGKPDGDRARKLIHRLIKELP